MTYPKNLKRFCVGKSGAMSMEYVTIGAIGTVVAIAFMYQIAGGNDGASGVTGLTSTVTNQLDAVSATLRDANGGGSTSPDNPNNAGEGNGRGNKGAGFGNGGPNQ